MSIELWAVIYLWIGLCMMVVAAMNISTTAEKPIRLLPGLIISAFWPIVSVWAIITVIRRGKDYEEQTEQTGRVSKPAERGTRSSQSQSKTHH